MTEDRCLVAGHDVCYFAFCDDVNTCAAFLFSRGG